MNFPSFNFLQIPPHDGHLCRSANRTPCRVDRGLSPPSHPAATMRIGTAPTKALRAIFGAPKKSAAGYETCRALNQVLFIMIQTIQMYL